MSQDLNPPISNAMQTKQPDATIASWYGLCVLILLGLFAVLDRQVFVLQAEPIRIHFQLTDLQLGMLQGLGVSLFAAAAGYPIGWLSDRYDRRHVMAFCIVVWSLAVVGCGFAQNFTQLFFASAMVGAGEAGLLPIIFALIPEMFRNDKRQLANSLNMVVSRVGFGLVIALTGYLTVFAEAARPYLPVALQGLEGWRLTFLAAAIPAPIFVILMLTLPVNGRSVPRAPQTGLKDTPLPRVRLLKYLRDNFAGVGGLLAGTAIAIFGFAAIGVWLPVVAMRQFGATPVEVGAALGASTFVSALIGLVFSYFGMRWLAPRFGASVPVVSLAVSFFLGGLALFMLPLATSANTLFLIYGVHLVCAMLGMMTYPTALQDIAPTHLRGRIFALSGILSIAIPSAAPPLVGALSDMFQTRPDGLLLVTVLVGGSAMMLSGAMLWRIAAHHAATVRAAKVAA